MIRTKDLKAAGLRRRELEEIRKSNDRLTRGHYIPNGSKPWERYRQLCRAVVGALKTGALLTGPSAAALLEVPLYGPPPQQVFVRGVTRGKYAPVVRVLSGPAQPATDTTDPIVLPATVAADCARVLSRRDAVIVADGLTHAGLCSVDELIVAARAAHGTRSADRIRWMAQNVDPASESPGETWTRLVARSLGFRLVSQVQVGALRLDFVVEGTKLAIEFDGDMKYSGIQGRPAELVIVNEKQRQAYLETIGYDILRIIWEQLFDPERIAVRLHSKGIVPYDPPWPVPTGWLLEPPTFRTPRKRR